MKNLRFLTFLSLIILLSFTTGCLFRSSSNPTGVSDVAQSQQLAQTAQSSNKIMPSVFTQAPDRKYTFAKSGHKLGHRFRENVKKLKGSLRLGLVGAENTEQILISFENLKVKPAKGAPKKITIDSRTIDLLSAAELSDVLVDAELDEGVYKYMEFSVKKAQIVVDGQTYNMFVPARKVRFFGKFEIKEGYTTILNIKFLHRIIKWKLFGKQRFILLPIVRISSDLELKPVDPAITDGDIEGLVENFVNADPVEGVALTLEGTDFSAVSGADGSYNFESVPAGVYTLRANHPDYLDYSFQLEVLAGQVASAVVQLNPAVIRSDVANTGWFSEFWIYSDANGQYAEVALEAPVEIDFVSLAFVKAEMKFFAQYNSLGSAQLKTYLGTEQQVSAETDLGDWWVGNTAVLNNYLGLFYASELGTEYTVDVTEIVRSNPSTAYYLAGHNLDLLDVRMTDIQLSIYYR
jgi:hypothetical protein